jgi:Insertion element 4 transposase N-terminal
MPAVSPSIQPGDDDDGFPCTAQAARVASGPGFWTEWLAELNRAGLLEELLAQDVVARALREAPAGHRYDRVLTATMTVICVLAACLFPGDGYDAVLAKAFGLAGLRLRPGTQVPAGSAFSQARRLLGEQAMRKIFELDAARPDAELGITALWKGLEVTAIDGTTMELARNVTLEDEFGTPADGARPLLRAVAHVRTASRRWIGAETGGYHDGENDLADRLEWSFGPGMLNLADRGFFSMDRFLRFSARGAELAWRVKNTAKSVPFKTIRELPDGSELVMLHESGGMRANLPGVVIPVPVEVLPPDQAARMFTRLSPGAASWRADQVAELVRLAGRLPLAISLLARVHTRHPVWRADDLIGETRARLLTLSAEHASVAAAFEVSWAHLRPRQQSFLACLGLHPGATVDAWAAAALAEAPLEEAERLLDELHGEGLVTETGHRRYGMHDLIRRYAIGRAEAIMPDANASGQ